MTGNRSPAKRYPWSEFRHRLMVGFLLGLTQPLLPASTPAQVLIPDPVRCEACTVSWAEIVVLGQDEGPGFIPGRPLSVAQDSLGRYWVLCPSEELPVVYAQSGVYLGTVGKEGEGPGEFRQANFALPIPGDSVVVFDAQLLRATVVDSALNPTRTIRLTGAVGGAVAGQWPEVLAHGIFRTPESSGLPYHLIDMGSEQGIIRRSFGGTDRPTGPRSGHRLVSHITQGKGSWFWTVTMDEYLLKRWNTKGDLIDATRRQPSWFRELSAFGAGGPARPPPPKMSGVWEDDEHRVWAFVRVSRPDWAEAWTELPPDFGGGIPTEDAPKPEELWRTTVEVLDLRSREVYARGELNDVVISVLGNGDLAVYRETDSGYPRVVILRASLSVDRFQ